MRQKYCLVIIVLTPLTFAISERKNKLSKNILMCRYCLRIAMAKYTMWYERPVVDEVLSITSHVVKLKRTKWNNCSGDSHKPYKFQRCYAPPSPKECSLGPKGNNNGLFSKWWVKLTYNAFVVLLIDVFHNKLVSYILWTTFLTDCWTKQKL